MSNKKSEPCCGVVPIFCCEMIYFVPKGHLKNMQCFDGFIVIIQIQAYM